MRRDSRDTIHETLLLESRVSEAFHDSASKSPTTFVDVMFVDLAEGMAGAAHTTKHAHEYGLKASEPCDILYGWDLKTPEGRQRWRHTIEQEKPLLVMVGFKCTNWCVYNMRWNFKGREHELEARQKDDEPMLRLMLWTLRKQMAEGRYYLFENPTTSALWQHRLLQSILGHPSTLVGTGHGCPYGLRGVGGGLLMKHWKWMTNHPLLLEAVTKKCCNTRTHQDHAHEAFEGRNTSLSGEYPEDLSRAILKALRSIAHTRDPYRFTHGKRSQPFRWEAQVSETLWIAGGAHFNPHDVFYLDMSRDTSAWSPILLQVAEYLSSRPGVPAIDLLEG